MRSDHCWSHGRGRPSASFQHGSCNARARAVQLPAWNEALGLPRPWDQQWSLRLQQVLVYESDLLEYGDLFDGSPVVEAKVREIAAGARAEIERVQGMGGAVAAI